MKKGDLFYVPSETMLFGKGKVLKTSKPALMINLGGDMDLFYETYFDNSKCLVRKNDIFPVKEGLKYDVGFE